MDTVLILDFGSQYTKLIAKAVRELGVYAEIVPWDISVEEIRRIAPRGLIFSGDQRASMLPMPPGSIDASMS
jgi:GMP synthase (glutamine-hydrolysing)